MTIGHSFAKQSPEAEPPVDGTILRIGSQENHSAITNATVLRLVGEGRRVLALGCTKSLLAMLRERGCEVVSIAADMAGVLATGKPEDAGSGRSQGDLGLSGDQGEKTFDVVLAVDSLEYLPNPRAMLKGVKAYLRQGGYVVAVVPNVAHGNIRFALLEGRFPFAEDAPEHFFTYESMVGLFEAAGFAIGAVEREEGEINASDDAFQVTSTDLLESVSRAPEARTCKFVAVAYPLPWPGLSWLQSRLRRLVEDHNVARLEAEALREDLEAVNSHVRMLVEQQEGSLAREKELRAKILEHHHHLMRRDDEYRTTTQAMQAQLAHREEEIRGAQAQLGRREDEIRSAQAQLVRREAEIRALEMNLQVAGDQIHHLATHRDSLMARLGRLRRTVPGRAYSLLKKIVRR